MDDFEEFVAEQLKSIPTPTEGLVTIGEVYETFTEEQKYVVHYMIGCAIGQTLANVQSMIDRMRGI